MYVSSKSYNIPLTPWQMFDQTSAPIYGVCHTHTTTSIEMNLNGRRISMYMYLRMYVECGGLDVAFGNFDAQFSFGFQNFFRTL